MTYQILWLIFTSLTAMAAEIPLNKLQLAEGWKASVFADGVTNARSMTQGANGVIFVGTREEDRVYAVLPDKNGDGKSDGVKVVAKGLHSPNGVAYKNGDLYIAEVSRILVIRGIDKNLDNPPSPTPWGPSFPDKEHHGWKFIAFGPDGWLYVPVGAPCNICEEDPKTFAAIHRISPDGKKRELVAQGVRNTVGFDWSPSTKNLWFTENGRDMMGDDVPEDELNHVSKKGMHFGYPYCHASGIADPEFGKGKTCANYTPPEAKFGAHTAALGMRFLRHQKDPAMNGTILAALHGSWNRTVPQGYQVMQVKFKSAKAQPPEPFLTGFLEGKAAWGRPVDVLELTDGSILVSDDKVGAVYRLTR